MWRQAARFSAVGLEMGIAVAIGYVAGTWLDSKLGTEPYLMVVMLIFGIGAAFNAVYFAAKRAVKDDRDGDGDGEPK